MTGYVRTDITNNIADGNIINATDLDNEFDGVQAAFNSSTGHNHDGTTGEGAPILVLGPTQDVVVGAAAVTPKTTNTVDIGSGSLKFKDLWLAGNANIAGTTTLGGALTYGGVTLSNAVTGTGNMVLSASPTLTGTISGANASLSGTLAVTGVATLTAQPILSSLTASRAVFTDGSKGLVSNAITGTGNVVMSASPTLTGTIGGENATLSGTLGVTGVATFTAQPIVSSLTASRAVFSDGSKGLVSNAITGTGNVVMSASPTLTGTITAEALTLSGAVTASGGTANGVAYLNGSKVLTTGSALTFDGTRLGVGNSNPATAVEVSGDITIRKDDGVLYFRNTGATAYPAYIKATDATSFVLSSNQNIPMVFRINDAEQMRLTSTGLGIGTSSPGVKLDVNSTAAAVMRLTRNGGTAANTALQYFNGTVSWYAGMSASGLYSIGYNDAALDSGQLRLDSSGNLGLGVTPSAWNTFDKVFQVGAGSLVNFQNTDNTFVGSNTFYGGSPAAFRYITSSQTATAYRLEAGTHKWLTAPSGTAGDAISFTQAMTLDASGNLTLGATSGTSRLEVRAIGVMGRFSTIGANDGRVEWGFNGTDIGYIGADSSTEFSVLARSGNVLKLGAGGAERARITSGGDLLVGTTSYGGGANVAGFGANPVGQIAVERDGGAAGVFNRFSSDGQLVLFRRQGTTVGSIDVTTTATSYVTSSDYRLKNTIAPMTGALSKVALLKPCTYRWNADNSEGEGFIAHELAEVVPQAVTGEKDAVDAEGKPQYQGIDTSFLVATLTAAIQEQQALIESLKARLDAANL